MKNFLTIFYLFASLCASSQNEAKIDSLKKLGRDSLIKLAVKKIEEPGFNYKNYDRITVKANKSSLLVSFDLSVEFIQKNSCFYDAVTVALVGSGTGKSIEGECDNPKFYSLSKTDKKKIDFVFNAINKDNEVGDIPDKKLRAGTTMKIAEKLTSYYVEVSSWTTYSHYKVDKITGKISDAAHKHYARFEDEKDDFETIK